MLKKIFWTEHVKIKMRQYGLSKLKLVQIINRPERKEKGIAPQTTAVMQTRKRFTSPRKISARKSPLPPPGEIWLMYRDVKDQRRVISAWRYPGISKPGEPIPIPQEILQEILHQGE